MALIACSECRREISDKAASCPGCGAPVVKPVAETDVGACPCCATPVKLSAESCGKCKAIFSDDGWRPIAGGASTAAKVENASTSVEKSGSSLWKWLFGVPIGGFVLLMIVGACAGNTPDGKERQASRDAISLCWSEQGRKSLDSGTARFVASTCEKMESDYRAKWGRNP